MSLSDTPQRDFVDELLTVEGPTGVNRIRPLLLAQTASIVRRRRFVRRLGVIAALAGCYLAGIATTHARKSLPVPWGASLVQQRVPPEDEPGERSRATPRHPESPKTRQVQPDRRADAAAAAVAQTDFDQIRRAGDRYLREDGDILSALDAYARALDRASPEDLAISCEEDSWLLMALKQARTEEDRNGNHGT